MRRINILLIIFLVSVLSLTARGAPLSDPGRLSLQLEDVPLVSVINSIAQQYDLNIVVSGEVTGSVTLRLNDVSLYSALNAILTPNGYNYFIRDDVIVVKSTQTEAPGEFTSRVVTLKYAEPVIVKKALDSRKSSRGKIIILDKTSEEDSKTSQTYRANRVLITDFPSVIDEMMALVAELDKAERLISIEVKIIETKVDNNSRLGIDWPTAVEASLGGGTTSATETTTSGTLSGITMENKAAAMDLETGQWIWGTLSVGELQAVLHLLEQNNNSKLLSDPRITTLENNEAVIKIQTIIPIPTINRFTEAASTTDILTFYDEEIGISLKVTPRINEPGKITMDVEPIVEDIIGYAGPPDNQKPITTERSVRTRITVSDGETAALGGLLKESEIQIERKVPLLGSIPILGKLLFTSTSKEKSTTDLLILITPHVMK